jgi:hypothetical protein
MRDLFHLLWAAFSSPEARQQLAWYLPFGKMNGRWAWRRRVPADVLQFVVPTDEPIEDAA